MIKVINIETGVEIGEIAEAEFEFLVNNLEEVTLDGKDYYIDLGTIEYLQELEMPQPLTDVLVKALGDKEEVDIQCQPM